MKVVKFFAYILRLITTINNFIINIITKHKVKIDFRLATATSKDAPVIDYVRPFTFTVEQYFLTDTTTTTATTTATTTDIKIESAIHYFDYYIPSQ